VDDILYGSYDKLKHWWYDIMQIIPMSDPRSKEEYPNRELTKDLTFEDQMAKTEPSEDWDQMLFYLVVTDTPTPAGEIPEINLHIKTQKVKIVED
jgi:hypothetical protein